MAVVGPVSGAIGIQETIWAAFAISLVCQFAIVALPSVRGMRASESRPNLATG